MSLSFIQCGFEEAFDYCQVMILKLNSKQWIAKNYVLPGRETQDIARAEKIASLFPTMDSKLNLFFGCEYKPVSFMSEYFYENKCRSKIHRVDDLYDIIQKDETFKEKLTRYYLGRTYSTNQEMVYDLMTGFSELDSHLKEMLMYFSMFETEYMALLFDSMVVIKEGLRELYNQEDETLKKLETSFKFDVIVEKKRVIARWAQDISEIEISFSYCNRYVMISGEIMDNRSWMVLGCDYFKSLERRWNNELPIEKMGNALGDAMRIRIIKEIQGNGEMSAPQLAKLLNLPSSAIFYHLDVLKKAFILCSRMKGRTAYYWVDQQTFQYMIHELQKLGGIDTQRNP